MKARYYIKAHLTRDGQHEGWDVREVTGRVDVCHTPCDTEDEAREELAAILAGQAIQKIEFKSEIPFGAWLYCETFGWACQNKSQTLSPEIRLRQGFTHFSTDTEKPKGTP